MNGYVCLSPPVIFQVKIKPHTTTTNKSSLRAPHTRSRVEKWNPLPRVVCTYRDHVTPHLIKYTLIINLSQKIFFIFMLCQRLFCSPAFKTHAELTFIFLKFFKIFLCFLAIVRVCSFAWISSAVIAIEGRTWFQANNCLVSYCVRYNSILRLFSQVAVTWCVLLLCELIGLSRDSLHCPRYRISNTTKLLQEQFKFAALPSSLVLKLITNSISTN